MGEADDEIPMILSSEKNPYRMKKATRLSHKILTSGSGADMDQVNVAYREIEHRQMSAKLTILILLVLVSVLIFLVLFVIMPIFYNLNHPLHPGVGPHVEETLERGHSHSSGGAEEHGSHDGMKEEKTADAEHMESQMMNSELWIQRISEICQCFEKLVEDGKLQSAIKIAQPAIEICLRSCFSSESTIIEQQGNHTPGPPGVGPDQPQHLPQAEAHAGLPVDHNQHRPK